MRSRLFFFCSRLRWRRSIFSLQLSQYHWSGRRRKRDEAVHRTTTGASPTEREVTVLVVWSQSRELPSVSRTRTTEPPHTVTYVPSRRGPCSSQLCPGVATRRRLAM